MSLRLNPTIKSLILHVYSLKIVDCTASKKTVTKDNCAVFEIKSKTILPRKDRQMDK